MSKTIGTGSDQQAKVAFWLAHLLTTEADSIFYGDYQRKISPAAPDSPEHEQACWLSDQADLANAKGEAVESSVTWREAMAEF